MIDPKVVSFTTYGRRDTYTGVIVERTGLSFTMYVYTSDADSLTSAGTPRGTLFTSHINRGSFKDV